MKLINFFFKNLKNKYGETVVNIIERTYEENIELIQKDNLISLINNTEQIFFYNPKLVKDHSNYQLEQIKAKIEMKEKKKIENNEISHKKSKSWFDSLPLCSNCI